MGGLLVRTRLVYKMLYEILQLSVVVDVKVSASSDHDTRPIHGPTQAVGALKTSVYNVIEGAKRWISLIHGLAQAVGALKTSV